MFAKPVRTIPQPYPIKRTQLRRGVRPTATQDEWNAGVPRPIRVLLIEDMDLVRDALVTLLSEQSDIEVVADLKCDDSVVAVAMRLRPNVAVIDTDLPCTKGLTRVLELRDSVPECQVVALAVAKPAGLLQRVLAAEVRGAVDKNAPSARLLDAIRGAAAGRQMVDTGLAVSALSAGPSPFTPRELEVLRLVADGASGAEIAERLSLSNGTVRNYLSKVILKTGARTRIDAIRIARESGWL
jgi:two-component system response regulator DesR